MSGESVRPLFFRSVRYRKRVSILIRWAVALVLMFFSVFPILWIVASHWQIFTLAF